MISYKPLFRLLLEKDMKKTQLKNEIGISNAVLAKMGKNEYVSMATIDKICTYFHCPIENVIEFIDDPESKH